MKQITFVAFALLTLFQVNSCGDARLGGIVDNGHHPKDQGEGGDTSQPDSGKSGAPVMTSVVTLLDGRISVLTPLGAKAILLSETEAVFQREQYQWQFTLTSQACSGTELPSNQFGTKVLLCDQTLLHFVTPKGVVVALTHNDQVGSSTLTPIIGSINDAPSKQP